MKRLNIEHFVANKYNHLLTALILMFVFSPRLEVRNPSDTFPLFPLIMLIVLVSAIRTSISKSKVFFTLLAIVILNFTISLVIYFSPENLKFVDILIFINNNIGCLFFIVTIYVLSRQLFRVHYVTADTIKGGICAYLLIGFLWAMFYGLLMNINPDSFIYSGDKMRYVYFSFTTLTTLGYGDIVPSGRTAAILTNSEAIIGQLYLTIFVARLVGLYIVNEMQSKEKDFMKRKE